MPARLHRHRPAGAFAAGESNGNDAIIGNQIGDGVGSDQQGLKRAIVEAGAKKDLFDGERALRDVRGVLEQTDIARHQCRCSEAENLPERKIPGHHGEHRTEGLKCDPRLARLHLYFPVAKKRLGIVCVVAAGSRAFLSLGDCPLYRLPHLERHQLPETPLLLLENQCDGAHSLRPVLERRALRLRERTRRQRQFLIDRARAQGSERPEDLACRRVGSGD